MHLPTEFRGKDRLDFKIRVLSAKPGDAGYSPLLQINTVTWKDNSSVRSAKSVQEIMDAENNGA